ncbi:phosphotransferase enzyme family protein [Toxoplasma gondii CAST]|uniref:Phosphotransferase enzyme family protein n=1 Tax=Toxoplasma gondii CAST TaxID=943122 RepID=A0A425HNK0_TOXGO|nr:phosphotransferase enzyme family protein [Toxoplasma gondii CAST]
MQVLACVLGIVCLYLRTAPASPSGAGSLFLVASGAQTEPAVDDSAVQQGSTAETSVAPTHLRGSDGALRTQTPQARPLAEMSAQQTEATAGAAAKDPSMPGHHGDPHLNDDVAKVQSFIGCCVKGWENLPESSLRVTVLSGGLSNRLFAVDALPPPEARTGSNPMGHALEAPERSSSGKRHTHCPCGNSRQEPPETAASNSPSVTRDETQPPQRVLVRLYGHGQEHTFFDAAEERRVFKLLGDMGLAPKCLAEFPGGRVETWIVGQALKRTELQNEAVQKQVVDLLADFHQTILPPSGSKYSADPAWCRWVQQLPQAFSGHRTSEDCNSELEDPFVRPRCDFAFCRLDAWAEDAKKGSPSRLQVGTQIPPLHASISRGVSTDAAEANGVVTPEVTGPSSLLSPAEKRHLDRVGLLQYYTEEAKKLEEVLLARVKYELDPERVREVYGSPEAWRLLSGASIVFSHNDVQENNVMQHDDGVLQMIDFEYSGRNFRSYDMGNLFREMTIDYADVQMYPFFSVHLTDYPSLPVRRRFITHYLNRLLTVYGSTSGVLAVIPRGTISKAMVDNFEVMVEFSGLISDLLWAFWSLAQMPDAEPSDEFSHMQYVLSRLTLYELKKSELIRRGLFPARK